jgi:hypothetical protein
MRRGVAVGQRRYGWAALVLALAFTAFVVMIPRPALGCSCAMPGDVESWIADTPAVVVGTLMDKRPTGNADFGMAAVFRVQVEEWVKGDLGEQIDVYTAADGAGCGIETPLGERVGLFLGVQDNRLTSSLCAQMDPDVLLAGMEGPVMSETGIPFMLIGGWNSASIRVVDETGGLITRLDSRRGPDDFAETSRNSTSVCPGGRRLAHRTTMGLSVWDLATMKKVADLDLPQLAGLGVYSISCRDEDASSVWYAVDGPGGMSVVDAVTEEEVLTVPNSQLFIGVTQVISQAYDSPTLVSHDLATGATVTLYEGEATNIGIYAAPSPGDGRAAVVETVYPEDGGAITSTLRLHDETGTVVAEFETPMEVSVPVWLDDHTLAATGTDPNGAQSLFVIDTVTEEMTTLEGWAAWDILASGGSVYGVAQGTILRGDLSSLEIEPIGTIADESAVALAVIEDADPIEVDDASQAPASMTPPLTLDSGIEVLEGGSTPETQAESTNVARFAFIALAGVALAAGLFYAIRRRPRPDGPSEPPSA